MLIQSVHSGGINLITDGIVARMSKIAVASSSYEHKVSGIRITKKFAAQSFALVRVVDGRLVIPRAGEGLPCWGLYHYVRAVKVCFC